ncbi:MAG: 3-methylornithine--L-lysine ligase PylC [Methanomassiliicoccaceae archaeon]|nr:3-methylornithine--L-lysine ligase PylC [Methanomassiliicoccaceae archaeon]
MRIAIVGGSLRGTVAAYLAGKAGIESIVIDKSGDMPAFSVSDAHRVMDIFEREREAMRIFGDCDAVIPACEDPMLLSGLEEMLILSDVPLLFDMDAYIISSSKSASNGMMRSMGIPTPGKWQDCRYPVIVKPSSHSGGDGITKADSDDDVKEGINKIMRMGDVPLIQEFVRGNVISVDVIGHGRGHRSFAASVIVPDERYDCKRVLCVPCAERDAELRSIAAAIAGCVDLISLMSVEAIYSENGMKVIEIDARLPTRSPPAVLAATGINLLQETIDQKFGRAGTKAHAGVSSYEFFVITGGTMRACGEKEFAKIRHPEVVRGMFGCDEIITDHNDGRGTWRCAMICSAQNGDALEAKRKECIRTMMSECRITEFIDGLDHA